MKTMLRIEGFRSERLLDAFADQHNEAMSVADRTHDVKR
jgi:hypothetical protein